MAHEHPNKPASPAVDGGLVRIRLDLSYDGTDFVGWARQPGERSVQEVVAAGIAQISRLAIAPVVTCAGRTDSGVHARGQVAHVDLPATVVGSRPDPGSGVSVMLSTAVLSQFEYRLRAVLPRDIMIRTVTHAPPGFDARYSALWRRYVYRVCDDRAVLDPWRRHDTLVYPRPLDIDVMNAAASELVGCHDFASFCRKREGATTIRTLLEAQWTREERNVAQLVIRADAFCHSMVRSLVGAMFNVGDGRRDLDWLREYAANKTRGPGVTVAAARGLVLDHVEYPDDDAVAHRQTITRATRSKNSTTTP